MKLRKRAWVPLLAVLVFYFAGAAWSWLAQPPLEVTIHEVVPEGEGAVIARLVRKATNAIAQKAEVDQFYKRDAHPAPHGCVKAWFTVLDPLDEQLRHGIYEVPGRRYRAWLRFSNALKSDDRDDDGRGMAIKVLGAGEQELLHPSQGDTQDFLMINGPTFFNRDVFEYEEFFDYQVKGDLHQIFYFIKWNPFRWRLREMAKALRITTQKVGSPLAIQYYSAAPYRLGPRNIKFSAKPCAAVDVKKPEGAGPHFLREAMIGHLASRAACFDFMVQLQDPSKNMPIEDPTILWREQDSPFRSVARIEVPPQEFSTDAQNQFCEQLSFSPWHGLEAHRPVGGINRARKIAYEAASARRHARNGYRRHESRGWCLRLDGKPCPTDEIQQVGLRGSP